MQLPRIAGVVLAGGRSRRMGGRHKAFLPLADKPLLRHVIDRVQPQVRYLMLSVERESADFDVFGLPQVPDPAPGSCGPLGGLLAALRSLQRPGQPEWLLLVPCDAPFVPDRLAERLFGQAERTGKAGALVRYQGEIQPTFSLWRSSLLPVLERAVTVDGMAGFKQFLRVASLAELDWTGPGSVPLAPPFFNINDQEALERARRLILKQPGEPQAC